MRISQLIAECCKVPFVSRGLLWSNIFDKYILGQKSNGPLQTMDCKMPQVRPIYINRISHSSAASVRQY